MFLSPSSFFYSICRFLFLVCDLCEHQCILSAVAYSEIKKDQNTTTLKTTIYLDSGGLLAVLNVCLNLDFDMFGQCCLHISISKTYKWDSEV